MEAIANIFTFGYFGRIENRVKRSIKRTPNEALQSDWEAVGSYLFGAMGKNL